MYIRGLTVDDFGAIVNDVSARLYDGNVIMHPDSHDVARNSCRARLRTLRSGIGKTDLAPGSRRSGNVLSGQRRLTSACWHAYRDVLAALFARFPQAIVKTAMARYDGAEGFARNYPATYYRNAGSQMYPVDFGQTCDD